MATWGNMMTTTMQFVWGRFSIFKCFFWRRNLSFHLDSTTVLKNPLVERELPAYLLSTNQMETFYISSIDHASFTLHCLELSFIQEGSSLDETNHHAMHYLSSLWAQINLIIMPCTTFHHCRLSDFCSSMPYPDIVLYKWEKLTLQWQIWNFGFRILICLPWFSHPAILYILKCISLSHLFRCCIFSSYCQELFHIYSHMPICSLSVLLLTEFSLCRFCICLFWRWAWCWGCYSWTWQCAVWLWQTQAICGVGQGMSLLFVSACN